MEVCCIIKPDALTAAGDIVRMLEEAGIRLLERRDMTYTPALVHELYDHMPEDARDAIAESLAGKQGIALLLEARSIDAVLDIAGHESDPSRCTPGTIRARYGKHRSPVRMGSWPWWENALHRPVDMREALRDRRLLFSDL